MSAKHTPGPWVAEFEDCGGYDMMTDAIAIGPDGHSVVSIDLGRKPDETAERDWANAHLIAAAPDLLEALKALQLQALQSPLNSPAHEWGWEALEMTRAAIRKAEGSSMNPLPETGISIGGRDDLA